MSAGALQFLLGKSQEHRVHHCHSPPLSQWIHRLGHGHRYLAVARAHAHGMGMAMPLMPMPSCMHANDSL
jgi:hypothetical protein